MTPKEEAEEILWYRYKSLRTYQFESSVCKQFAIIRAYDEARTRLNEALECGNEERAVFYQRVERELDKINFEEVCPYEP